MSGLALRDARCLVTGATGGIGRAVAVALAHAGAHLVVHGRDATALAEVAAATGGTAVAGDLADDDGPAAVASRAVAALGRVDVLVANAGAGWAGPFSAMDPSHLDHLLALDLRAPLQLARALLPGMLARRRGHLVVVASVAAHVPVAGEAAYAGAKAGLAHAAEALRVELEETGVGVSVVSPAAVATPFFARRGAPYVRRFPRPVPPERVAAAVVRSVQGGRPRILVPRWLEVPARLHAAAPAAYRALASRLGQASAPSPADGAAGPEAQATGPGEAAGEECAGAPADGTDGSGEPLAARLARARLDDVPPAALRAGLAVPLHDHLGIELTGLRPVVVEAPVSPWTASPAGPVHGGVVATLVDVAGGVAAATSGAVDITRHTLVTTRLDVRFLAQPGGRRMLARAEVVEAGRRTVRTRCTVADDVGTLVAEADVSTRLVPLRGVRPPQPPATGDRP